MIESRIYGKSELAEALRLSRSQFGRILRNVEPLLTQTGTYRRRCKLLYPNHVSIILIHIGVNSQK